MPCSGCKRSGHNIRTCPEKEVVNEKHCSVCKEPGHNRRTCGKVGSNLEKKPIEKTSQKSPVENKDKKLALTPRVVLERCDPRPGEKDANKSYRDLVDYLHITSTDASKDGKKKETKIEVIKKIDLGRPTPKSPTYIRDTDQVKARIQKGPPEQDGPGYIYMYELDGGYSKVNNIKLDKVYKIGLSEQLPGRRVKTQESRNKESYNILRSWPVAWRKLTEKIIHLQLSDHKYERDVVDGRTEWFQGERKLLEEVINDSKVIVQSLWGGMEPQLGL